MKEPWAPLGSWRSLSPRIRLWVPHWLKTPTAGPLLDQAINEVLTVVPEPDTRIPTHWRGVDPDPMAYPPVAVVIMDPIAFGVATDAAGLTSILAAGLQYDYSTAQERWHLLYCGWRQPGGPIMLPVLPHELRHRLTGDPMSGHPGGCCNRWLVAP